VKKITLVILIIASVSRAEITPSNVNDVQSRLDEEHQLLLDAEVKKRGILGTLYDINRKLNHVAADVDSVKVQMVHYEKSIKSYAQVINKLETVRDQQKSLLRERLRSLYKLGAKGYAAVLLSSQSNAELSRNMKFLKIITEKDFHLIENYKKNLELLAVEQTRLRQHIKVYLGFQKNLEIQQKTFADEKESQLFLLARIDKDRNSHIEALKEWREAGLKLEEKMANLDSHPQGVPDFRRASFIENRGFLKAPVARAILQKYGIIKNEKFHTKIFNKGLFFAAQLRDSVESIFDGKVAYSGWIDGYGETIIIDHGDHYYSLYAHNSKLEKKIGDAVTAGETIALAGDTASLRGPGLYIEIRHFSESLDPLTWLDLSKASRL
jgi:septal ring factor EnvC (AmiA/AmiB activator)